MIAGAVSSAVATPFDVLKVRLQSTDATESVKQESYLPGRFKDIFAREGVRGLYRGAGPTTLRGAMVAGAQGSRRRFCCQIKILEVTLCTVYYIYWRGQWLLVTFCGIKDT